MSARKSVLENRPRSDIGTATPGMFSSSPRPELHRERSFAHFSSWQGLSMDQLLLMSTRAKCERYKVHFAHLSAIQRKFVTHDRCSQCGLLPLYHLNLLHIKRVRCRKCGQLIAFKKKGKYGKLRREIAVQLARQTQGGITLAVQ